MAKQKVKGVNSPLRLILYAPLREKGQTNFFSSFFKNLTTFCDYCNTLLPNIVTT
jgi:hypothetical protein